MREYIIKSTRRKKDYIWGRLYYSDRYNTFKIKWRCTFEEMRKDNPPPMVFMCMPHGRLELDKDLALSWVEQRIIPKERQNIDAILKSAGLKTYREIDMLELCMGRCTLDDIYLERVR